MIITRASQYRHRVGCFLLLAATGLACGSNGTGGMTGTGGGSGAAGTSGAAGSVGSTGSAGTSGTAGTSGDAGTSGTAGTGGSAGGNTGAGGSSVAGSAGSPGSAGSTGSAGTTGGRGGAVGTGGRGGATGSGGQSGASGGRGGATGSGGAAGAAVPSAGCSANGSPTSGRFTIDVSGTAREYIIKLPTGYDPRHPYRLIFAFHGASYDAASVAAGGPPSPAGTGGPYYAIEPLAGGSAIFVAPQALSGSWTDQSGRDVAYVNAMLARFKAELCIDQSRVFATGFSMGAIMTITVGCAEADQFRAIAPMSGSLRGTCGGTMPIAYWGSHGDNDPTIAIAMGRTVRDTFRMRNHCTTTTVAGTPAGCVDYQGCDAGYPVGWCEFADDMHRPPPYAGEAIWRFLSQF